MAEIYSTPLARWARALEIFIPGYMFGKSYGIADEKTVDLYRAQFPAFLINIAEYLKAILCCFLHRFHRFYLWLFELLLYHYWRLLGSFRQGSNLARSTSQLSQRLFQVLDQLRQANLFAGFRSLCCCQALYLRSIVL